MPIFVIFVFASVVFGAGLLLSPALPTPHPRIGLAAALALAGITCAAVGYTALFKWDTLIIDYLWFGLLVGIFLTGTFSMGMFRAESEGRKDAGWPGPRELAFFLMVAILFAVPPLIFPVPLDTDAQGFGYLALMLRNSGSLTTLAPFHPEISYLYSPGFLTLVAYLGHALNANFGNIQLATGGVLSVLFVWLAYDFGNEVAADGSRRTGVVFGVAALIGTGLLMANLDSHYTTLLAFVFIMAFLTFAVRWLRYGKRVDLISGGFTLAAVALSHPDSTIILALGYVPWLLMVWLARPRPTLIRWLGLAAGIPSIALVIALPWIIKVAPLLGSTIQSPFEIDSRHLIVMTVYHGGVIVLLSLIGIVLSLRRRNAVDLLMLVWLLLVLDFSSVGLLARLLPGLLAPILKYDYPFSIAWHGPIIPYVYFGATAILWIMERIGRERADHWIRMISLPAINMIALVAILIIAFAGQFVSISKQTPLKIFGAFSSHADVRAMEWLKFNTPNDALVLNHPGPQEGDWVPVISQRDSVYFRPQPFFRGTEEADGRQTALLAFWKNPADPANAALLHRYHIDYVIVPQIITKPERLTEMFRWRLPASEAILNADVAAAPYLKLIHDDDGAQVYEVQP